MMAEYLRKIYFVYLIGIYFFSLGFLTSCGSVLPEVMPPMQDSSLVSGIPCSPPCWQNIVPEKTSVEEAKMLLSTLTFVDPKTITRDSRVPKSYDDALRWRYQGATLERHGGLLYVQNGVVISFIVHLPRCIAFGEIVSSIGDPDLVRASRDPELPYAWYDFYYPSMGLMIHGRYLKNGNNTALIVPEICIYRADYFGPDQQETYFLNIEFFDNDPQILAGVIAEYEVWPGFGESIPLLDY